MKKQLLCLALAIVMVFSLIPATAIAADSPVEVRVTGTEHHTYAAEVFSLVNENRSDNGASALTRNATLSELAMQRAAEIALYYESSHLRPDDSECFTIIDGVYTGWTAYGENIAIGQTSPEEVMDAWMNSEGHRANILDTEYTQIGIGCFYAGGIYCWVQLFSNSTTDTATTSATGSVVTTHTVSILPSNLNLSPSGTTALELEEGSSTTLSITTTNPGFSPATPTLIPQVENATDASGNVIASVTAAENGTITVTAEQPGTGSAKISVYSGQSNPLTLNVTVPGEDPQPPVTTEPTPTEPDHYHVYEKWTITEFPSATSDGEKYSVCTICGNTLTTDIMYTEGGSPDGHSLWIANVNGYGDVALSVYQAEAGYDVFLFIDPPEGAVTEYVEILDDDTDEVLDASLTDLGGGYYHFLMPDTDVCVRVTNIRFGDYTITATTPGGGDVWISTDVANEGEVFLLTVTADDGYYLDQIHLYTNGTYAASGQQISPTDFEITMPDGDLIIEVHFILSDSPFVDVKESDYYYEPVLWAVSNGVTSGISANRFGPSNACTRAQVVTFLWRACGCPDPQSYNNPFTDVKSSDYYYKAVLWAVENGITSGVSTNRFGPNNVCTRAQVVTFLWRTADSPDPYYGYNPFSDVKSTDYYYNAVLWAVEYGITSGVSETRFGSNNTCTRGQIVTFLYKAFHG